MAYLRGCHLRAVSVPNWRLKRRELAWESYFRGKPASEREAHVGEWSRERLEKMDRKFCRECRRERLDRSRANYGFVTRVALEKKG